MAFQLITVTNRYLCLSTDEKQTEGVLLGSKALETDTDKVFIFNGTGWSEITGLNF